MTDAKAHKLRAERDALHDANARGLGYGAAFNARTERIQAIDRVLDEHEIRASTVAMLRRVGVAVDPR